MNRKQDAGKNKNNKKTTSRTAVRETAAKCDQPISARDASRTNKENEQAAGCSHPRTGRR